MCHFCPFLAPLEEINSNPSPLGKLTCGVYKRLNLHFVLEGLILVPDVCNYGYVRLTHMENIVMKNETVSYINMTTVVVFSTIKMIISIG